jgi:hypothetical protein
MGDERLATTFSTRRNAMKTVVRRLTRLEDRYGDAERKLRLLLVLCRAGWGLALDQDRCVEILDETAFLPHAPAVLVNLSKVPDGLNAEGTQRFLRENAAEICSR